MCQIMNEYVYGEQKTAWSEEDEKNLEKTIWYVEKGGKLIFAKTDKLVPWLKSIKDRVQLKQEWSKEDEYCTHQLIVFCENCMQPDSGAIRCANWLKSLKDRYTWKPSDEQMEALANALSLAKNCGEESAFDLRTLYEQLKKLKE